MKKINPHNTKYFNYYMELARLTAKQSVAVRRKVGAVIVLPTGLIGLGWNGMPAGFDNCCEYQDLKDKITKPEVIHAERNALDKLTRQGVSSDGAILFTTTSPCIECAKSIASVGLKAVIYEDYYHSHEGSKFLVKSGVEVYQFKDNKWLENYHE